MGRRRFLASDYREQIDGNRSLRGLGPEQRQMAVDLIAGTRYIDVTSDFGFKWMFRGHDKFLIMLLRDVLGVDIVSLRYADTEPMPAFAESKRVEFDVRCTLADGTEIDVEMQKEDRRGSKSRFVYYGSRLIDNQLRRGDGYASLKPVKVVCVLNYEYDHPGAPEDKMVFEYCMAERQTHERYGDELSIYLLELPRFSRTGTEIRGPVEEWLYVIGNLSKFAERPQGVGERFDEFLATARTDGLPDKVMDEYIKHMLTDEERDDIAAAYLERGIKQGMAQGIVRTARAMLGMGLSVDVISRATGLGEAEILALGQRQG